MWLVTHLFTMNYINGVQLCGKHRRVESAAVFPMENLELELFEHVLWKSLILMWKTNKRTVKDESKYLSGR